MRVRIIHVVKSPVAEEKGILSEIISGRRGVCARKNPRRLSVVFLINTNINNPQRIQTIKIVVGHSIKSEKYIFFIVHRAWCGRRDGKKSASNRTTNQQVKNQFLT